jgi:hypothetical protein
MMEESAQRKETAEAFQLETELKCTVCILPFEHRALTDIPLSCFFSN